MTNTYRSYNKSLTTSAFIATTILQIQIYQNSITHNHYADNSNIGNRYYTMYIVKILHGNVKMPQRYHSMS